MRYRMEVIEDKLIIRNVETDIALGTASPFWAGNPHNPERPIFGCNVLNKDADRIAEITVPNPIEVAPSAIATYEAYYGYPGFKDGPKNPDTHRIEWQLGTVLADAVTAVARAFIEYHDGGLKAETKEKCAELTAQLYAIWYPSRFGSFDGERRINEPYFANGSGQRIGFGAAAQRYGLAELQMRFPDVSETTLKTALEWPLYLLRDLLDRLLPLDMKRLCAKIDNLH